MTNEERVTQITEEYIRAISKIIRKKEDIRMVARLARQYSLSIDCAVGVKTPKVEGSTKSEQEKAKKKTYRYEHQKKTNDAIYYKECRRLLKLVESSKLKSNVKIAEKLKIPTDLVRCLRLPRSSKLLRNQEFCKEYVNGEGTVNQLAIKVGVNIFDVREAMFKCSDNINTIRSLLE